MLLSCLPLVDGVSNLIPGSAASGVLCSSSNIFTGHDSKDMQLFSIPKRLLIQKVISALEISTQKRLGTVDTRFYIGEMF